MRSYNGGMTIDQFKAALRLQPYKPFKIRMAARRSLKVEHPDFVAQSPPGRTVVVFHQDEA